MLFNGKYRMLKKMHYVSDQQGILQRYLREAKSWVEHLENTKKIILQQAENKNKRACAILGSGWLLDIPVEELATMFEHVYLYDVLHPKQIKHKMKKYNNVHFVEEDITGGAINELYEQVQLKKSIGSFKPIEEISLKGFQLAKDVDYVVSANILNQLDILLVDYIKGYGMYSEDELRHLRVRIQQQHLDFLPQHKTCLITDIEEKVYSNIMVLEETNPLVYIPLPKKNVVRQWEWNFDHQTYRPEKNIVFNVLALAL
jgi:hypothetical protein